MLQEAYYRQPTCQLWLTGESHPLLAWATRQAWENLQFTLRLSPAEDTRHLAESPVIEIHGQRSELEALYRCVNNYIQALLAKRRQAFTEQAQPMRLFAPASLDQEISTLVSDVFAPAGGDLSGSPAIFLTQVSPLSHHLHLGPLRLTCSEAQENFDPSVLPLSLSQLFDLGNLLGECWPLLQPQPGLGARVYGAWQKTPVWVQSTAVAAVVLGVTTALIPWLQPENQFLSQEMAPTEIPTQLNLPLPTLLPKAPADLGEVPPPANSPQASVNLRPIPLPPIPPPVRTASPVEEAPSPFLPRPAPPQANAPHARITIPAPTTPAKPEENSRLETGLDSNVITSPSAGAAALRPLPPNAQSPVRSPAAVARSLNLDVASGQSVAAVRSYFSQRWQPPAELSQTLEYTLILNPDGSLQRALPLNRAAEVYIDRTPIPLANEPFVAATNAPAPVQLRLVLEPMARGGGVQVFSAN
ncbi:DUF4335 domain-containing protein [Synechococcus sp. PCC 6312]|uniref:DUF4335 domain-containing protein n=1 Tax=Synechococcus sp. (strain ATCC 27167 / PCC 6312) TaxID=195253 RepID=UPI00029F3A53|nr:DUF4335 domain-containing protein [Synechococcus sp. PCC 6312]AFY62397.1 hypothetical protein Syn6312_3365 [Synechococcus sp. PCC 6312]